MCAACGQSLDNWTQPPRPYEPPYNVLELPPKLLLIGAADRSLLHGYAQQVRLGYNETMTKVSVPCTHGHFPDVTTAWWLKALRRLAAWCRQIRVMNNLRFDVTSEHIVSNVTRRTDDRPNERVTWPDRHAIASGQRRVRRGPSNYMPTYRDVGGRRRVRPVYSHDWTVVRSIETLTVDCIEEMTCLSSW